MFSFFLGKNWLLGWRLKLIIQGTIFMGGEIMTYKEVPDILTGKDLNYLSDMFTWNYIAFKGVYNDLECVEDEDVIDILSEASGLFYDNMNDILMELEAKNE